MFKKWSKTSIYHYYKLLFRSFLLILITVDFIRCEMKGVEYFSLSGTHVWIFVRIVWAFFIIEMLLRMFPASIESMGCQKQFSKNCTGQAALEKVTGDARDLLVGRRSHGRTTVLLSWLLLNGIIGVLYYYHIINEGILMIIAMVYSVCDMICILFFCPFQTWFMKNRCCVSCYIYNWDYAMMFTPLIFVPNFYTYTLLGLALIVLLQWEIKLRFLPERFDRRLNDSLQCKNCTEKLCKHKKQLQGFIKYLEKKSRLERLENSKILNTLLGLKNQYDEDNDIN